MTDMRIVLAVGVACLLWGALCIRLSLKAARIRPAWPVKPADRQPIAVAPVPPCHCGQPIPAGRKATCSPQCRFEDDDHGPNGDDQ